MKPKKIIMIAILIAFITAIVIVLININNKSAEKIGNNLNTTNTVKETSSKVATNTKSTIRKSTGEVKPTSSKIIEITDNFFIEQTNDVYLNTKEYIGKTIKIQGLVYNYKDTNGDICYAVVRNTPGCCGNDGLAGLDIRYDKNYPKVNTWVEVLGVVGTDTVFGEETPVLNVLSIKETEKGKTFVTN